MLILVCVDIGLIVYCWRSRSESKELYDEDSVPISYLANNNGMNEDSQVEHLETSTCAQREHYEEPAYADGAGKVPDAGEAYVSVVEEAKATEQDKGEEGVGHIF